MKTYSATRIGENKTVNQDCFLCETNTLGEFSNLFIVADGMGGHNGGEIASRFCVDNVKRYIQEVKDGVSVISVLRDAIKNTNDILREKSSQSEEIARCGTTAVIATISNENVMYIANIGDSRLYHLSDKTLKQITEDHSLVEEMVKKGHISREKARFHPDKNIITKAIGSEPVIEPDFFEVEVKAGDRVLLCSDGVSNMMDEGFLMEVLSLEKELSEIGEILVNTAVSNGGKDDITLVIIEV